MSVEVRPPDPLLAWRGRFPILEHTTYLISNSLGAMPAAASDSLAEYTEAWAVRGVRAWEEGWWESAVETGDRVAPLLGVPAGTVAMHPNVTIASAVVRSCFDWSSGRKRIVMVALEFPSILYLYQGARAEGAEIVIVPAAADGLSIDLERLLDAIDERTALVAVSHVLFRSAFVMDAAAICERARAVGARACLDVYQSAGTMVLDLETWGADFAVGGCLKWLCGGPGNAFLHVRGDLHARLEPRVTGWMAHAEPFAFDRRLRRSDSITRFLTGTPNVPAHYAARPGLAILGEIGPASVREKSVRQTSRIIERARELEIPLATPDDPARRGGTVTLAPPDSERIARRLLAEEILVDHRPGAGIRLAPHFYTTDEECDRAVDRIAELTAG
ncbi:MAG TPA: aminotransferase class V-fold PLP-dependent enzyme [Gemmatimonadota bacterium]|nr:aminotransferase class V-fold PLP-dependent enzyme [Gemmatimonadota bacterium]